MKKSINKYKLIIFTGIITLLIVTLGVSYSIFNYAKQGEKESSITTGSITFIYTENDNVGNGIVLTDSFPISDEEGKKLTGEEKVFDFKVQANLSRSDIEYEIVAEPTSESNIPLDAIKFYLTEVNNNTEKEIANSINLDSTVKTLKDYEDTTVEHATGKTIYQETILRNTKGYIKNFRARMWLNDSIEFDENYINKSGSIRITVYANTDRSLASNTTTTPSDVSLERVTANNKYLFTASNSTEYQYELTVPSEVDTLSVDVFPSNTGATYTIEKIQKMRMMNLSEMYTLDKGDNYFRVVVTSSDTKNSKEYILKVTREYSNNTDLNSLEVEGYTLTPIYSNNIDEYSLVIPSNINSINIIATQGEEGQTITGTGVVGLKAGINEIKVEVTAENGIKRTIKLTVERGMNSDASINNVGITGYKLVRYQDNIYYIEVENSITSVTINNISTTNATVIGIGEKVNLQIGNNDYPVTVISEDQTNRNDYVIRIIRKADAINTLKSLSLTNCEIGFNSETTDYTCTVENSVTKTKVTAEATSSLATISGTGEYSLDVGTNTIEVVVKAQNGLTKTYTVTINRKASSDATLKLLEIENQTLTPTFDKNILSYTLTVPYSVDNAVINASATSSEATVEGTGTKILTVGENTFTVKVTAEDGTPRSYQIIITRLEDTDTSLKSISIENHNLTKVDNNHYKLTVDNSVTSVVVNAETTSSVAEITSGLGTKELVVGDNKVYVIVTAQSGDTEAYEIIITRLPNSDATLKSLSVNGYNILPAFESTRTEYTLTVPYSVTSLTVNAEKNNSEASVEISGNTNLQVGSNNKVNIVVTAEDKTEKTYTITVTRQQDTINTLKSLSLTNCEIQFNSETTTYSCTVENSVTETTVSAQATSSVATLTGTGTKTLNVGTNTISVKVTSQSGLTKTYTVTVTRKASSDATLKSLSITNQTITPAFNKDTLSYTLTVPYSVDSVVINASATSGVATVEGTGTKTLTVGENTFAVKVTAEDKTTKTYTITVTRQQDTDTSLKSISVTNHSIIKVDDNHYTLTVNNSVTSVVVNAEATSSVAEITSGTGTKTLSVGENKIYVIVTSQSGDTETYEIVITRLASSDATLKALSVSNYTISPTFAANTTSYTLTVPYSTSSITVNATKNNTEASVTGTGNKSLNVGSNTVNVVVTAGDGTKKTYIITVTRSKDTTPPTNIKITENSKTTNAITVTASCQDNESGVSKIELSKDGGSTYSTYSMNNAVQFGSRIDHTTAWSESTMYEGDLLVNKYTMTSSNATVGNIHGFYFSGTEKLVEGKKYTWKIYIKADRNINLSTMGHEQGGIINNTNITTEWKEISHTFNATNNTHKAFVLYDTDYEVGTTIYIHSLSLTSTEDDNSSASYQYTFDNLNSGVNYDIKARCTNGSGYSSTANQTISTNKDTTATLKSLSVSNYTISPTFSSGTTAYTLTVPYSTSSITVNAAATSSVATVTGTGNKSLNVGSNTINVVVTAGDGTTKKTYTITVTRQQDTTATLSALSVGNCTLNPTFASGTTSYTCTVENSVTSTTISATATSGVATVTGTGTKTLSVGTNSFSIIVTAQSGNTKTYTVTITRKPSSDATLSALSVSNYTISPTFASGTTSYTLTVPYSTSSITVNATKNNTEASVTGTGNKSLNVGSNTINVVVTAGDGTTKKTYTITVTRSKDTIATLSALNVGNCTLSPTFASGTTSYTCTVENSVTSTNVTATATSSVATVTGTGAKTLNVGSNTVSVVVTAQDGTTKKTYTVTVTRKASSDATLSALSVSNYTISPTFASGTTSYTLTVPYSVTSLTVNATKNNSEASVAISGNTNLQVGSNNKVNVVVTAGDGTKKTYTITVTRQPDSTSTLKNLSVNGYSISPTFASGTTEYSVTLEAASIVINAETTSSVATVTGTGTKTLSWGTNTFSIIVTAQSGATKTYTLTVNNNRPTAPVLTGGTGSSTWTNKNTTISVATAGTAISNVKNYEYYTTTSTTTPSDSTTATGTTANTVTISTEGTTYVYYRTVSNNGNKSPWSSPQVVKLDITGPNVEISKTVVESTFAEIYNTISDDLSGLDTYSKHTFKYSTTEGDYTNHGYYRGKWPMDNLAENTTYYYQLCIYDLAGNSTCKTGNVTTQKLGTATITYTNTPSTSQNGYLKKQVATINYSYDTPKYYYVKTTRNAKSSISTNINCGTNNTPINCGSTPISYTTSLSANTWYRFTSKPKITYDTTSTSNDTLYVIFGDTYGMVDTTTGIVSKIDATTPTVAINSATVDKTSKKINIKYDLTDSHSGIATYTCSVYQEDTVNSITISNGITISGTTTVTNEITTTSDSTSCSATVDTSKAYVGYKVCATDKVGNTSTCKEAVINSSNYTASCAYAIGDVVGTFNYTGSSEEFTIPCTGTYKLEVYGAQGGAATYSSTSYAGGNGGYSYGNYPAPKGLTLFVNVGGMGTDNFSNASTSSSTNNGNGYNGGAKGSLFINNSAQGGGGGATHIAIGNVNRGELKNYENYKDEILIVAGGGGGAAAHTSAPSWSGNGGAGGGLTGQDAQAASSSTYCNASGGTQQSGGLQTNNKNSHPTCIYNGAFGLGSGSLTGTDAAYSGGGGGYYGGAGGHHGPAAGGSGYIGGVSNGVTMNSMRTGNGYAKITLVSFEVPDDYEATATTSTYDATASTSTYIATASTVNCGRWKLKYGSHYYHTCETCGYDIVNSGYASISGTPGSYCSSHYGTYHTKTTYTCPNGGTLSGTTCTNTTYTCPNGGTLSGSTCTKPAYICPNGGILNESTNICEF